jgi:hypothetical protein
MTASTAEPTHQQPAHKQTKGDARARGQNRLVHTFSLPHNRRVQKAAERSRLKMFEISRQPITGAHFGAVKPSGHDGSERNQ